MPNKITFKLLVEYENIYSCDGDSVRRQFQWLKDAILNNDLFDDATVTCLSIERDGKRVLD